MKIRFLFLLVFCFMLVGCSSGKKEVATVDTFEKVSNDNEFTYLDNIGEYGDINYINYAKKAIADDIVIEFIEYKDTDSVDKVQEGQIKNFKNIKSTAATEHKNKGKNYYKFWMVSNGYYMVSSKVGNTLIFCKTSLDNKEKVEKFLENIGY